MAPDAARRASAIGAAPVYRNALTAFLGDL